MSRGPRSRLAAALSAAAIAVATLVGSPASANPHQTDPRSSDVAIDLLKARLASAKYHDIGTALADGYHPPHPYVCVDSDAGTMGYHFLKWDRLDDKLNIRKPELMLYAPDRRRGGMRLVAVEYMVPDADQDLSTDDDRPTLFGRPFDGPMEGHEPGMPIHYDLHVWIWSHNPDGTFAQWNSAISC